MLSLPGFIPGNYLIIHTNLKLKEAIPMEPKIRESYNDAILQEAMRRFGVRQEEIQELDGFEILHLRSSPGR